jgi:hypothetical protein
MVHAQASFAGYIQFSSEPTPLITITLVGMPHFSVVFAMADSGGTLVAPLNDFDGRCTGQRYDAHMNGVLWTAGKGANYFPGSVAGATYTGGQYG